MRLIYEAPNTVEAHMILNLLEQAGLSARIDGEYLQGGIGELQVVGVVRVMVEEYDYPAAKLIIEEWDAK
jgi:Putative prokaryotic signal transducing protein